MISIFADLRAAVAAGRDTVLTAPEAEGLLACLDALGDHWGRLEALTDGLGPTDLPPPAQLQLANMAAGRGQAFRLAIATLSTTTARQP